MLIHDKSGASLIATCLAAAGHFHLDQQAAIAVIERQIHAIGSNWPRVCAETSLGPVDRAFSWGRQFLNPFAFHGLDGPAARLAALGDQYRAHR